MTPALLPSLTEGAEDPIRRTLQALADANALDKGSTQVVDISVIRQRLADRWPLRRERVWEHVDRVFRRLLGREVVVERVDETSFLVSQIGCSALHSQIACIRATSELMRFFLGSVTPTNVRISNVLGWSGGELVCTPLDERQLRSVLASEAAGDGRRSTSFPILTKLGRTLSVDLALTPVYRLKPEPQMIGHFARTAIFDAASGEPLDEHGRADLQPGDLAELDCKVLADTLELQAMSPTLLGSVVVPISYYSLANTSARFRLLRYVKSLTARQRRGFIWELVDLEPGIPIGRLAELVPFASSACRGMICRLDLSKVSAEKVGKVEAPLSIAPPAEGAYTIYDLLKLESGIASALRLLPSVLLHDVPLSLAPVAGLAGATHCTVVD